MKKALIIIGAVIIIFLAMHAAPSDPFKDIGLDGSIRNADGGNLVPTNILSDPSVLSGAAPGSLGCKFPAAWNLAGRADAANGPYDMWFTSHTDNKLVISRAKSADGGVWNDVEEAVLKPGPGWDAIGVETASVIRDPAGKYRMYYTSSLKDHDDFAIGMAISDNGSSWIKSDRPVLEPENEWEFGANNGVQEPSVIYDAAEKRYKMWYSALGEKDGVLSFRTGYAVSDDGVSWRRHKEPVLESGNDGSWDDTLVSHVNVVKGQDGYHMFYFGVADWDDGAAMQKGAIGHAYSADGITWQKDPGNPILKAEENAWYGWTVGGPTAVVENGKVLLWFFGNPKKGTYEGRIGLVEGTCGQNDAPRGGV